MKKLTVIANDGSRTRKAKLSTHRLGLDRVNSFSFRKYGKEAASSLAMEWCSRMQYFFSLWQSQADPDYCFSQADLDGYCESLEWIDFMLNIPNDATQTLERARKLRCMCPSIED